MTLATEPNEEVPAAAEPRPRAEFLALCPAGVVLVGWLIWISANGGYYPDLWYPSALVAVSLLVITLLLSRTRWPRVGAARVALLAFLALVGLNYLSAFWAESPGSALDAANLLLLYAAIAWIFSVLPWTPRSLTGLLCIWALGIAAFCALALLHATSASSLDSFFVDGRFSVPMHYANATAAIAVMGMWPSLILSARRELPIWLRAACLMVAVFLAEFALLPQSRAALVGIILTVVIALLFLSDRLVLLSRIAVVGCGLAVSVPRTIAVDHAVSTDHPVAAILRHAASGMLLTSLAALAVGALLAWLDTRWSWSPRRSRRPSATNRDGTSQPAPQARLGSHRRPAVAAVVVVALCGAAVVATPAIVHAAKTIVRKGNTDASTGTTRLISTTPEERFDYARVAFRLFANDPILGVGAGNFGRHYDALRRFEKHSLYAHDLALRVLSETGIIGFALLFIVIAALGFGLVRAIVETRGLSRACAVASLTVASYFLAHGSLDWLDEFPALAAPAFALAMAAITLRRSSGSITPVARPLPARRAAAAIAAVALVAIYVALSGPYLSKQYVAAAFATFRQRLGAAMDDLKRAQSLDPLSADPSTSEGTIELSLDEPFLARASFERSLRRENAWYPRLELALLAAEAGRFQEAARQLNAAAALDADDPAIAQARSEIGQRKRIDPVAFNRLLVRGAQAQFFKQQHIK